FAKLGLEVKAVVSSKHILPRVFDSGSALLIREKMEANGVEFILEQDAVEIIGEGDIKAVKLASGKIFASSLVVVCKGAEPNIEFTQESGIETGIGIRVDASLRTNIENIYAAGDVCGSCAGSAVYGLWPVAVGQGAAAGENMSGGAAVFESPPAMNSVEFFGLPAVSLGIRDIPDGAAGFEELKSSGPGGSFYRKIVIKDNRLAGAVLVGNTDAGGVFGKMMKENIDVSAIKEKLLEENFGCPAVKDLLRDADIPVVEEGKLHA
ncbi:MAG: FAD-dependent oxidoreductase, partial [Candidatus Omnitrophica bacterium]|nr:FAD-dependent oxidoreductase [Candidatus Omnitrophota bacterium]